MDEDFHEDDLEWTRAMLNEYGTQGIMEMMFFVLIFDGLEDNQALYLISSSAESVARQRRTQEPEDRVKEQSG